MTKEEILNYPLDECPKGWHPLVKDLLRNISHHLGRYQEVEVIRDKLLAEGKEITGLYDWINKVLEYPEDPMLSFGIDQVKSKFGGLRFYYHGGDEWIRGAVAMVESISYTMCETCGANSASRINDGWTLTLCNSCNDKRLALKTLRELEIDKNGE